MKYSENNKPLVCMQTNSTCYKGTSKMIVQGVLWHSTGANNPYIKRYVQPSDNASDRKKMLDLLGKNDYGNDWNHIYLKAGVNGFIGKLADGTVATVQTMPWDYSPWGCGAAYKYGPSCNNGWIQFEICEDGLEDEAYFNKVYTEACELTAYLCKMYDLDPQGTVNYKGKTVPVILCHADAHKLRLGSNHGDVLHWFKKHGKTMDDVRVDVAKIMKMAPEQPVKDTKIDTVKEVQKWLNDSYFANLVVDGIYGAKTKKALVKVLQKALGVTVDGVYGPKTNQAIKALKKGSSGSTVKALQGLLVCNGYPGAYIDGSYGNGTFNAVKSYQEKKKLSVDGIAGRATFSALCM